MNYNQIINKSFSIAWKNKSLWLMGLFAGGWMPILFVFSAYQSSFGPFENEGGAHQPLNSDSSTFLLFPGAQFIVFLIFVTIHMIMISGLTNAVFRTVRGYRYKLFESITVGARQFLRLFCLFWLTYLSTLLAIMIIVIVAVFWFLVLPLIVPWLAFIPMSLLFIAYITFLLTWFLLLNLSQRAMAIRNSSIRDSLAEAWYLLRNNKRHSFMILMITGTIWLGCFIPFVIIMDSTQSLLDTITPSWLMFTIFCLLELPIIVWTGTFMLTVLVNIYTLFYLELLEPGILDPASNVPSPPVPTVDLTLS